jgi:predicted DNA-binding helix-hairpin-helix protein
MILTQREKSVLLWIALIILCGASFHYFYIYFPAAKEKMSLIEHGRLSPKLDVNTATFEELVNVPFIGEYTARSIISYRKLRQGISYLEELKNIPGIKEKNYERFVKHLRIKKNRQKRETK